MKKTSFIMLAAIFIFTACKKNEPETLAGTAWEANLNQTHEQDGKSYSYIRIIDLNFSTSTGNIVFNSATLTDAITLDAITLPFSYTYNSDTKEGSTTFMPNGEKATFSISGNTLKMSSEVQTGISININFTKK